MPQSPHFDGKVPNWFHYACFWKRGRPNSEDEIHGFHSLRWEDQQKIKEKIGGKFCHVKSFMYVSFACQTAVWRV